MADNKKPKRPQYKSPKGVFKYPKLVTPDTKFKADGEFSVKLVCPGDSAEVTKLIALIDEEAAKSLEEAKQRAKTPLERKKWETKYLPYAAVLDEEGNETGEIEFKFTAAASGTYKSGPKSGEKWTRRIALFDAKGKPMTGEPKIGGGSIGFVSFEVIPYGQTVQSGASVKLGLNAAQIVELREFGDKSAASYGFGAEEGYDSSEAETNEAGFADETAGGDTDEAEQRHF